MIDKRSLLRIFLPLAALALVACNGEKELRYMSYNVRNGSGMVDSTSYTRTASVIKQWNPDVVAIQELDSVTERSKQKYVLGELAELTGMHASHRLLRREIWNRHLVQRGTDANPSICFAGKRRGKDSVSSRV